MSLFTDDDTTTLADLNNFDEPTTYEHVIDGAMDAAKTREFRAFPDELRRGLVNLSVNSCDERIRFLCDINLSGLRDIADLPGTMRVFSLLAKRTHYTSVEPWMLFPASCQNIIRDKDIGKSFASVDPDAVCVAVKRGDKILYVPLSTLDVNSGNDTDSDRARNVIKAIKAFAFDTANVPVQTRLGIDDLGEFATSLIPGCSGETADPFSFFHMVPTPNDPFQYVAKYRRTDGAPHRINIVYTVRPGTPVPADAVMRAQYIKILVCSDPKHRATLEAIKAKIISNPPKLQKYAKGAVSTRPAVVVEHDASTGNCRSTPSRASMHSDALDGGRGIIDADCVARTYKPDNTVIRQFDDVDGNPAVINSQVEELCRLVSNDNGTRSRAGRHNSKALFCQFDPTLDNANAKGVNYGRMLGDVKHSLAPYQNILSVGTGAGTMLAAVMKLKAEQGMLAPNVVVVSIDNKQMTDRNLELIKGCAPQVTVKCFSGFLRQYITGDAYEIDYSKTLLISDACLSQREIRQTFPRHFNYCTQGTFSDYFGSAIDPSAQEGQHARYKYSLQYDLVELARKVQGFMFKWMMPHYVNTGPFVDAKAIANQSIAHLGALVNEKGVGFAYPFRMHEPEIYVISTNTPSIFKDGKVDVTVDGEVVKTYKPSPANIVLNGLVIMQEASRCANVLRNAQDKTTKGRLSPFDIGHPMWEYLIGVRQENTDEFVAKYHRELRIPFVDVSSEAFTEVFIATVNADDDFMDEPESYASEF